MTMRDGRATAYLCRDFACDAPVTSRPKLTEPMEFPVDIWLRGDNHATTQVIAPVPREPRAWTDADVSGGAGRYAPGTRSRQEP